MRDPPDWLSPPDREFFEWAVPVLKKAARRHRLKPEPWFKDVAMWALHFRHPRGGTGQIVVEPDGTVMGDWWRDDYESETRHMAATIRREATSPSELTDAIRDVLARLTALGDRDLVTPHQMPPGTWHRHFTAKSLTAWERSLPKPKPKPKL